MPLIVIKDKEYLSVLNANTCTIEKLVDCPYAIGQMRMFSLDIGVVDKRNQKMIEIFTSELKTPSDTTFKKYETSV